MQATDALKGKMSNGDVRAKIARNLELRDQARKRLQSAQEDMERAQHNLAEWEAEVAAGARWLELHPEEEALNATAAR